MGPYEKMETWNLKIKLNPPTPSSTEACDTISGICFYLPKCNLKVIIYWDRKLETQQLPLSCIHLIHTCNYADFSLFHFIHICKYATHAHMVSRTNPCWSQPQHTASCTTSMRAHITSSGLDLLSDRATRQCQNRHLLLPHY